MCQHCAAHHERRPAAVLAPAGCQRILFHRTSATCAGKLRRAYPIVALRNLRNCMAWPSLHACVHMHHHILHNVLQTMKRSAQQPAEAYGPRAANTCFHLAHTAEQHAGRHDACTMQSAVLAVTEQIKASLKSTARDTQPICSVACGVCHKPDSMKHWQAANA